MRKRAFIMVGLAVLLAVSAVFVARDWLQQQVRPIIVKQEAAPPTKTIVVARSKLEFGHRMRAEHVREIPWPASNLPTGAFEKTDKLFEKDKARIVLRSIEPNEPVLASRISGEGGRGTLSALISEEMRALTVRVNDVLGVAGFVRPGDRVDMLLTRDESKKKPITDILLQNVKVLGIDQESSEDKDKPKVARAVTVEVTPRQAQKLTLAARVGVLSLALRAFVDGKEANSRTVRVPDLRVSETVIVPPKPKVAKKSRRVFRRRAHTAPKPNPFSSVKVIRGLAPKDYRVKKEFKEEKRISADRPAAGLPIPLTPRNLPTETDKIGEPTLLRPDVGEPTPLRPDVGEPTPLRPDLMSKADGWTVRRTEANRNQ